MYVHTVMAFENGVTTNYYSHCIYFKTFVIWKDFYLDCEPKTVSHWFQSKWWWYFSQFEIIVHSIDCFILYWFNIVFQHIYRLHMIVVMMETQCAPLHFLRHWVEPLTFHKPLAASPHRKFFCPERDSNFNGGEASDFWLRALNQKLLMNIL